MLIVACAALFYALPHFTSPGMKARNFRNVIRCYSPYKYSQHKCGLIENCPQKFLCVLDGVPAVSPSNRCQRLIY